MSSTAGGTGEHAPRSFSERFQEEETKPFPWKAIVKRVVVVTIAGVALYVVAPVLIADFHAWPKLATLNFIWLALALVAEMAHFACTFTLQRMALRTKDWFTVITSQLAGNAICNIVPGGAAAGAAVQFRMLATSGMDAADSVGGLTAFSLLGVGGLLALPVFVLPVILFGAPVNAGLTHAAIVGAVAFVLFAAFGAVVMSTDAPLRWCGRAAERVRNRLLRRRKPLTGLSDTLLEQRDLIRSVLGRKWWQASLLSSGRLALDFLCLLFALRAVGSHPRPSLALLAYAVAGVIGLIPVTPGGLGIVEASMTGLLVLAGVSTADAILATLTYRVASYWLPTAAGPVAYAAFKWRYRHAAPPPASTAPAPA